MREALRVSSWRHVSFRPQMVQEVEARDQAVKAGVVGNDGDQAAVEHRLEFARGLQWAVASDGESVIALRDLVTEAGWRRRAP